MPEESKESKAQKLAAARKKLKEYQKRGGSNTHTTEGVVLSGTVAGSATPTPVEGSISSNISERSDSELNFNGHEAAAREEPPHADADLQTAASYFNGAAPTANTTTAMPLPPAVPQTAHLLDAFQQQATDMLMLGEPSLNTIQVLIAEKGQLTGELNKYRNQCRRHELDLEELRTQYNSATERLAELQQRYEQQQQAAEQLRRSNAELQHKMAHASARNEEQADHLAELKKELQMTMERCRTLTDDHMAKCNDLEMAQLRIQQISDESDVSKDARVEALTQTQHMYEQQVRDLQAMVQQLQQDKDQSNQQYQNYTQHLSAEANSLHERNAELLDECAKLQERERQLVDHISQLERDIQRNISRQDQLKASESPQAQEAAPSALQTELDKLNGQLREFELERHEFQLKIKSQEDRLGSLSRDVQLKEDELQQLRNELEQLSSEQPDTTKLLATMESDKVAASRAVTQNVELKRQLDELERRFVELTNDKAELMNQLDAEVFANREMRASYEEMLERVRTIDERFKFKDEEMIRLSHENMELSRENLVLQQQVDRLRHYEAKGYSEQYRTDETHEQHAHTEHTAPGDGHQHEQPHDDSHSHSHDHTDSHEHGHAAKNSVEHSVSESSSCQEATEPLRPSATPTESHGDHCEHHHEHGHGHSEPIKPQSQQPRRTYNSPVSLPTAEAVEKLEQRFTQLISQVADLTDEKQRLEHLVLQLQGETETIGEYITLYQTQRRILKQREYEKAAQTRLLQEEREQLRDKITVLNNLVSSLGVESPIREQLLQGAFAAHAATIEPTNGEADVVAPESGHERPPEQTINEKLNTLESQQILTKIQHIITEIKENTNKDMPTVPTVDNLNCCLGKFEVV